MQILKDGDRDKLLRNVKFECGKCGCIFIADKNEYKHEYSQREACGWYEIHCPYCKSWVTKDDKECN